MDGSSFWKTLSAEQQRVALNQIQSFSFGADRDEWNEQTHGVMSVGSISGSSKEETIHFRYLHAQQRTGLNEKMSEQELEQNLQDMLLDLAKGYVQAQSTRKPTWFYKREAFEKRAMVEAILKYKEHQAQVANAPKRPWWKLFG